MTTRYALRLFVALTALSSLMIAAAMMFHPIVPGDWYMTYAASPIGGDSWSLFAFAPPRRLSVTIQPDTAHEFTSTTVYPVLSPDSSHYVSVDDPGMLTVHATVSDDALFSVPQAVDPAWSPDGEWLAYGTLDDQGSLAVLPVDERVSTQVTDAHMGTHLGQPRWSPDGEWLAFTAHRPTADSPFRDILLTNGSDDVDVLPIAAEPELDEFDMAWSPDGTQLAYVAGSERSDRHIYIVNADGTDRQRITLNPNEYRYPTWSPDGEWLVYLRYQGTGDWAIVRMSLNDPERSSLVLSATADESPLLWSPDGDWLAYVRQRDNDIYLVREDGQRLVRVTDNDSINVLQHHWR